MLNGRIWSRHTANVNSDENGLLNEEILNKYKEALDGLDYSEQRLLVNKSKLSTAQKNQILQQVALEKSTQALTLTEAKELLSIESCSNERRNEIVLMLEKWETEKLLNKEGLISIATAKASEGVYTQQQIDYAKLILAKKYNCSATGEEIILDRKNASGKGILNVAISKLSLKYQMLSASTGLSVGALVGLTVAAGAAVAAIGGLIWYIEHQNKVMQESLENLAKNTEEQEKFNKSSEEAIEKYEQLGDKLKGLSKTSEEYNKIKDELIEIQNNLNSQYEAEYKQVDLVNGKYEEQLAVLKEIQKNKAQEFIDDGDNVKDYKNNVKYLNKQISLSLDSAINSGQFDSDGIIASILEKNGFKISSKSVGRGQSVDYYTIDGTRKEVLDSIQSALEQMKQAGYDVNNGIYSDLTNLLGDKTQILGADIRVSADEIVKAIESTNKYERNAALASKYSDTYLDFEKASERYNNALKGHDQEEVAAAKEAFYDIWENLDTSEMSDVVLSAFRDILYSINQDYIKSNSWYEKLSSPSGKANAEGKFTRAELDNVNMSGNSEAQAYLSNLQQLFNIADEDLPRFIAVLDDMGYLIKEEINPGVEETVDLFEQITNNEESLGKMVKAFNSAFDAYEKITSPDTGAEEMFDSIVALGSAASELGMHLTEADIINRNVSKDMIEYDDDLMDFYKHYLEEIELAKELGLVTEDYIFGQGIPEQRVGNVDTATRVKLEWDESTLQQYEDRIKSWYNAGFGSEYSSADDYVNRYLGSYSTVDSMSDEFNGYNITFTPMFETDDGVEYLGYDEVSSYINSLFDYAEANGIEINAGTIMALDQSTQVGNYNNLLEGFNLDGAEQQVTHLAGAIGSVADAEAYLQQKATEYGTTVQEMIGDLDYQRLGYENLSEEMDKQIEEQLKLELNYEKLSDAGKAFADNLIKQMTTERRQKAELNKLNSSIDKIQDNYNTTKGIIDDYNKTGYISIDNAQKLLSMDTEYLACLEMKNGKLQVNEEMYRALMKVQLMKIKADLEEAASEEIIYKVKEIVAGRMTEDMAVKDAEINKNDQLTDSNVRVAVSEELAAAGLEDFANVANAVGDAVMAKFNGIYASIMEAMSALNFADAMAGGSGAAVGGGGGGGSASASDPWKDAFDAEYKTLKHNLTMEYITQKQYYDQLKALNEKYFAGREEYLDEYRQYEEEIYTGMKEWYKEQLELELKIHTANLEKRKIVYTKYVTFVKGKITELSNSIKKMISTSLKGTFNDELYLSTNKTIEKIKKNYKTTLDQLATEYKNGTMTKDDYNRKKKQITEDYKKELNEALAKADKVTKLKEKINNRTTKFNNDKASLDKQLKAGTITQKKYDEQLKTLQEKYKSDVAAIQKQITAELKKDYAERTVDFKKYIKEKYDLIEKNKKNKNIDNATYLEQMKAVAEEEKEIYELALDGAALIIDKKIKSINDEIDKLQERNDVLAKEKEQYDKALSAVNNYYDKKIDALNEANEKLQKQIDLQDAMIAAVEQGIDDEIKKNEDQIKIIDEKIESLNKENEARKKQMDLSKAAYDLERAYSQKTVKTLKDGQFVWEQDEDAIRSAQEAYDNAILEKQIYDLEQEKEAIEKTNEALEKLKEKWEDIATAYEKAANLKKLQDAYGEDALQKILEGDETILKKIADAYYKASEKIDLNEQEIEKWEELKKIWEEAQNKFSDAKDVAAAKEIFGDDWESAISDIKTAEELYKKFREAYYKNEKETDANEDAIEKYQKQIEEYEKVKEKWEEIASLVENAAKEAAAMQLMKLKDSEKAAETEKNILEGRIDAWNKFAEEYLNIQQKIAEYDEALGKEQKNPTTNGTDPGTGGGSTGGGSTGGGGEQPSKPGTGAKKYAVYYNGVKVAGPFDTEVQANASMQNTINGIAESRCGSAAAKEADVQGRAAGSKALSSYRGSSQAERDEIYKKAYDQAYSETYSAYISKEAAKITGYSVNAYAKGGIVGKNKKNPLDAIAQSVGEDHMIAAKEGERILTPEQNKTFEKLIDSDPDKFAMLMKFTSISSSVKQIEYNTSQILSNLTKPNISNVNNVSNNSSPVIHISGTTFTCTGVTGEQVMKQIQDSFTGLVTNAYQQVNKR